LGFDAMHWQAGEVFVPLREPGVEHGGVGDLHGLPVVGRGEGRLFAEGQDEPRAVPAELGGQRDAGVEGIEQPAVGEVEREALVDAELFGGGAGFGKSNFGARRERRGLAVGEVDNADAVALPDQMGERAAATDFDVVGVSADGDDVEGLGLGVGHV
jgi:hypothetical protein